VQSLGSISTSLMLTGADRPGADRGLIALECG